MSEQIKVGDFVFRKPKKDDYEWLRNCNKCGVDPLSSFEVTATYHGGTTIYLGNLGGWDASRFELVKPTQTAGVKFDSEKPRVDLLIDGCPNALEAISQVLTFGAKKYADHNWQKVPDGEKRYKAALMRHLLASSKGEKTDSETNLSHLAHAACCVLFMLELELTKDERI